jgi:putative ABC transport system ATP-binding protein
MRAIAGLDRPTGGALLVEGRDLGTASPAELRRYRRERVTYISQKAADNFIPHLTLRQHAEESPQATGLFTDFGLAHRLNSKPIELSGGEQARGAFALALARGTPLVVVDEPTAELDRESARLLLNAIHGYARTGTAFVVATHDPDVTGIADTVLRLDRGRVVTGVAAFDTVNAELRPSLDRADVVLAARDLIKSFARGSEIVRAVQQASLELRTGELGVLLGRSGSGKSTLLTLLAGWQRADSGTILHAGEPTQPETLPWAALSYLPQRFGLIPELSVRENIAYPARLTGRRKELEPRVDELLEQLGLEELADRPPPETSIGQQQRTALARALILRPALILADEPTSHQDAGWREAVWRQLLHAATEDTTCLVATHEEEASAYASRLWSITEGAVSLRNAHSTSP